jgi:hypothetical protein
LSGSLPDPHPLNAVALLIAWLEEGLLVAHFREFRDIGSKFADSGAS